MRLLVLRVRLEETARCLHVVLSRERSCILLVGQLLLLLAEGGRVEAWVAVLAAVVHGAGWREGESVLCSVRLAVFSLSTDLFKLEESGRLERARRSSRADCASVEVKLAF